jgi:hypothetical protein
MPVANADNPPIGTWGSHLHMLRVYVPHPTKPPLVLPLGESSVLGGRRRVVLYVVLLLRPFCDLRANGMAQQHYVLCTSETLLCMNLGF